MARFNPVPVDLGPVLDFVPGSADGVDYIDSALRDLQDDQTIHSLPQDELLRRLFAVFWTGWPADVFPVDRWVYMFKVAGATPKNPDPWQPIRLYRGAEDQDPHGLSWTPRIDVARYYADKSPTRSVYWFDCTVPELIAYREDEYRPATRAEIAAYQATQKLPRRIEEVIVDSRLYSIRRAGGERRREA